MPPFRLSPTTRRPLVYYILFLFLFLFLLLLPPYSLLLLGDDDGPLALDAAVHDVHEPGADLDGVLAALAVGSHGGLDLLSAVADGGYGADEVL